MLKLDFGFVHLEDGSEQAGWSDYSFDDLILKTLEILNDDSFNTTIRLSTDKPVYKQVQLPSPTSSDTDSELQLVDRPVHP